MQIPLLDQDNPRFPDPSGALTEPDGLLPSGVICSRKPCLTLIDPVSFPGIKMMTPFSGGALQPAVCYHPQISLF